VLGEEHPDTFKSMDSLAVLLQNQRKYDEAEVLYRKALDGRKKVLGEEHPDTLSSMSYYAYCVERRRYREKRPVQVRVLKRMMQFLPRKTCG